MPNHVKNVITVNNGTAKQRLAFICSVINSEGFFDFNRLVYRPKSLEITSGGQTALFAGALSSGKLGKKTLAKLRQELTEKTYRKELREAKAYISNFEKYGFGTWYEWSLENWGTKWNAYSQEMPVQKRKSRIQRGYRHRPTHIRAYEKRLYKNNSKTISTTAVIWLLVLIPPGASLNRFITQWRLDSLTWILKSNTLMKIGDLTAVICKLKMVFY
ncbi:hypothetical protein [Providencia sp. PROV145]|uniref:hypothetical protein n=1 Tax=Providencia sp. PROV145 TaxID=2949855 RepID=UPI0023493FCD|nr:hypothetical protein [Providencia sp. PROV145]